MGHKIFVSYKYADDQVANLVGQSNSTVRDYVDKLEDYFDSSSHIYKGLCMRNVRTVVKIHSLMLWDREQGVSIVRSQLALPR